jgi:ferredoxin
MCPENAITKLGPGKRFAIDYDYDYCKGCGIYVAECPTGVVEMVPEQRRSRRWSISDLVRDSPGAGQCDEEGEDCGDPLAGGDGVEASVLTLQRGEQG